MAAAEYYNSAPQPVQAQSPFQYPPPPQGQTAHPSYGGSPNLYPQGQSYPQPAPPPYQAANNEHKPSVHFASSPVPTPQQPHRPSMSNSHSNSNTNYLAPPGQSYQQSPRPLQQQQIQHANSYHGSPAVGSSSPYPPNPRPYMNGNQSMLSVGGYSSDPEPNRRRNSDSRRHRRDDREVSRERGTRGHRSRSTNTDGFLGAAGGGLIGDMIFPGLGTVGGALAGWIGGRDYGKHRKSKEERRSKEQEAWERQHGRSGSCDSQNYDHHGHHGHDHHSHDHHHHRQTHSRERRSWERHHSDY